MRECSLAIGVLFFVACGGSAKKGSENTMAGMDDTDSLTVPRVDSTLCDTEGKKISTFDLNQDNMPDVWKLYVTTDEGGTMVEILTCKQVDFNHDGKKDYVQTFSRTGEILAEEFDFTFEGKMDAREHYDKKTGNLYLIERDSDHDSKPDVWEKYGEKGKLESVRRDRNADGNPDLWEQYKDGELIAILYDDDYDNKVDRKESLKTPPEPTPAPTTESAPAAPVDETPDPAAVTEQ